MASRQPSPDEAPFLFPPPLPAPPSPRLTNGKRAAPEADPDFVEWWRWYPKKRARLDAEKAWRQTKGRRPPVMQMIIMLQRQIESQEWQRAGGAYIPHPATYLRGGRWEDVLTPATAGRVRELPVGCDEERLRGYER